MNYSKTNLSHATAAFIADDFRALLSSYEAGSRELLDRDDIYAMSPHELNSMMVVARNLLAETGKLLGTHGKWIKHRIARDKSALPVDPISPDATCFCLMGGISNTRNKFAAFFVENETLIPADRLRFNVGFEVSVIIRTILKIALENKYPEPRGAQVSGFKTHLPSFNDAPETTQKEVIALINDAIKLIDNVFAKYSVGIALEETVGK